MKLYKRGNVEFLLLIIYAFIVTVAVSIILFQVIQDTNEKIQEDFYKTLFSQNLFLIINLFQQGGEPVNDINLFFSKTLTLTDLGLSEQCGEKIIYTNFIVSKIAAITFIDPKFYMKLLSLNDYSFYFKVYDAKEGKTFYYDPLIRDLNFDGKGFILSTEHLSNKKYSYGYSLPVLLVDPTPDCDLNALRVEYPNETKTLKYVPAVFYVEIYKE